MKAYNSRSHTLSRVRRDMRFTPTSSNTSVPETARPLPLTNGLTLALSPRKNFIAGSVQE